MDDGTQAKTDETQDNPPGLLKRWGPILAIVAAFWCGCRSSHQFAHIIKDDQADIVGSHAAGADFPLNGVPLPQRCAEALDDLGRLSGGGGRI